MVHAIAKLKRKVKHLPKVFGKALDADPSAQITSIHVLEKKKRLSLNLLDEVCLSNVIVEIQIHPR
jgi:hypothetical protein